MDKSIGQSGRTTTPSPRRGGAGEATRRRLLTAAAQLIAEVGWGRVTTRAVAERAGLPHGAVSYHFRGKRELLGEAAMHAFSDALPADSFAALTSLDDFIALMRAEIGTPEAVDPVMSRLMMETLREAERDPWLRERMGEFMATYRAFIVNLVRNEQENGRIPKAVPAEGLATLLAAVGDGLLMHALLDPQLEVDAALDALGALLSLRR